MNHWQQIGYTPRHPWPDLGEGYAPVRVGDSVRPDDEFNAWCPFRRRYMGWADVTGEHIGKPVIARGPVFRRPH